MSAVIELQGASLPLDLERRPERAVNGATRGQPYLAPTDVQALLLSTRGRTRVLVGADVVWFGTDQAAELRRAIAGRVGIEEVDVALCATHTHGTPNPDPRFAYGESSDGLASDLRTRVLEVVDGAARAPARRVRLEFGRAPAPGIAVHRRRLAWTRRGLRPVRRVQNLPNRVRRIDERLSLIALRAVDDGTVAAAVTHFACHPVADPGNIRGADYPGLLRGHLKRRFGGAAHCVFLQGFCGDTRPNLLHRPRGFKDHLIEAIIGSRFRPALPGDSETMAERLADAAGAALASARPVEASEWRTDRTRLPLKDVNGGATDRTLDVTSWSLDDRLRLVFANAEMLSALSPTNGDTLAVGYANGMEGYVAAPEDYAGGGYEIDGFLARFGLSARFDPGNAVAFRRTVAELA